MDSKQSPRPSSSSSHSSMDFGPSETLAVPNPPRRRQGGNKRRSLSNLNSSFPSAKRLAKERNNPNALLPPIHSGPVTRARQSPMKIAAAAAAAAAEGPDQAGRKENDGRLCPDTREEVMVVEEPIVDKDFEEVRSREKNIHVVPSHAGWFSWKNVHSLEKRTMPSFFDGKSENRTPKTYIQIRNSIIKKFRANPQVLIELSDLGDISVGDSDTRQEVMEFLDYWGLINFHPFPPSSSDCSKSLESDESVKKSSLLEKLYQFETVPAPPNVKSINIRSSAPKPPLPSLFAESTTTHLEDLTKPVESDPVEYHCNPCGKDCSHKRYHCRKEADFDLCPDCYNANKFGPGMVSSDFIIMESVESRGASGGSWTDQETLLLLEGLELYSMNWNEIAEHVATKAKDQCMLHFFQMPIEDSFLEGGDGLDGILSGNKEMDSKANDKDSVPSDIPEIKNDNNSEEKNLPATSNKDLEKNDSTPESTVEETPKSNDDFFTNILTTAFQDAGTFSKQFDSLSFSEAGNPVMALAAFLAGVVEPDAANISIQSSLKAMCEDSPGIQLATRHCFPLEDPPSDGDDVKPIDSNDLCTSESFGIQKGEDQHPTLKESEEKQNSDDKDVKDLQTRKEPSCFSEESHANNVASDASKESRDLSMPIEMTEEGDNLPKDSGDTASPMKISSEHLVLQDETNLSSSILCTAKETPASPGDEKPDALIKDSRDGIISKDKTKLKEYSSDTTHVEAALTTGSISPDLKVIPQMTDSSQPVETKDVPAIEKNTEEFVDDHTSSDRKKRAAITSLSAATVTAKIFVDHEEDQIRQLVSMMIEKQLQKLEVKMKMLMDLETPIFRVREQLDRSRKKLHNERKQIIAARFGMPTSSRPPNSTSQNSFSRRP